MNQPTCASVVRFVSLLVGLFLAIGASDALAHEGHDDHEHRLPALAMRSWSHAETGETIQGTFLAVHDEGVQVCREDGTIVVLEVSKLSPEQQRWVQAKVKRIEAVNRQLPQPLEATQWIATQAITKPHIPDTFEPFAQLKALKYWQDENFFYVESDSMPDHRMMVGITVWQQQVPLPQPYFGSNAWRIPLQPVVARNPLSAKSHFFRGAIALAANGVPIFNPVKNDGRTDTLLAGELDEYGGHCGRADDYHYHIAPTHLQTIVGQDKPIAYALDGYPIYGYEEPDGTAVKGLDEFNGHSTPSLGYHYHATKTYPYLNGGFHGEVREVDGQVDPQPQAGGVREALPPLRGATITGFENKGDQRFSLKYQVGRETHAVNYQLQENGSVTFQFVDGAGNVKSETYAPRRRGPGGAQQRPDRSGRGVAERRARDVRQDRPRQSMSRPQPRSEESKAANPQTTWTKGESGFSLSSSAIGSDWRLDKRFTCDGEGVSPPIAWKAAPAGTKTLAISLWHTAPDQEKSYWLVYNIPANVDHLNANDGTVGVVGLNDKRRAGYDPMCSKGPGIKTYYLTVFALSQELNLPRGEVDRKTLLRAIQGCTLAETTLDFQYER